jgi:hypothetical protein
MRRAVPAHGDEAATSTAMTRANVLILAVLALATASCGRSGQNNQTAAVTSAFHTWKSAVLNRQTSQAMTYIPRDVDHYLAILNTEPASPVEGKAAVVSPSPGVDLLLRTALDKKVPSPLRANLTLAVLWQRITDRHLFNPRDLKEINLGRVSISGDHASADIYYEGSLTALRLPFIREDGAWKIDVMAILPYAEVLMRVDRAIKGETESQQVDQLVTKLPSL